jgi:hypothetical protein
MVLNHTGYTGGNSHVIRSSTPTLTGFNYNWDNWNSNSPGAGNAIVLQYYAIGQ